MNSAEEVAAKLRAAWAKGPVAGIRVLGSLYADSVEIHHVPPMPGDGMWEGAKYGAAIQQLYDGTLEERISGFRQEVQITVMGDEILSDNLFSGTLKDGTPLRHRVTGLNWVKNGKIVKGVTIYNSREPSWEALLKAMSP